MLANDRQFEPAITAGDAYLEKLVRVLVNSATPADPELDIPAMKAEYAGEVENAGGKTL
jgi:hypothetical protein